MGDVRVAGHMARKSTVRDLSGSIINMLDEADGGWIIRNRQVVNQDKFNAYIQKEKDKVEAAQAVSHQVASPNVEERAIAPSKVDALEKKVEGMETKLDAILKALSK